MLKYDSVKQVVRFVMMLLGSVSGAFCVPITFFLARDFYRAWAYSKVSRDGWLSEELWLGITLFVGLLAGGWLGHWIVTQVERQK